MSNRRNDSKSNSTKKSIRNEFDNFRMEALEPRLLQQVADLSPRQREKAGFLSLRPPCMVAMGSSRLDFILYY